MGEMAKAVVEGWGVIKRAVGIVWMVAFMLGN